MKQTNPYYKLDEVGFVGSQKRRTKSQIKEDIEIMQQFIQADKAGKPFRPSPQRNDKSAAKK